jgi:FixJ family two-component response regulator
MRKPRVIIFNDDSMLLELLEFYFDKWGYEVFSYQTPIVCSSGSCESRAPCADLVISDFKMPQMTGIELFQLQAQRGCRIENKMKAIMSDHADGALLKQCKDLGYRFIEKPFYSSELYTWVSECERHFDLSKQLVGKKPNKRYDFIQDIEYCLNACPQEKFIGFTVNKSVDGLGLRVFNPLYAGQEITILNGLETPNLKGTVIWCNQVGESAYRAGLCLKK